VKRGGFRNMVCALFGCRFELIMAFSSRECLDLFCQRCLLRIQVKPNALPPGNPVQDEKNRLMKKYAPWLN